VIALEERTTEPPGSGPPPTPDDRARRRRRRRLLGWSALPALALLGLAGVLLGRAVANERGIDAVEGSAFARERAIDAVTWFDRAGWFDLGEGGLAAFNRGVAWFRAGELGRARSEFEVALRAVDEAARCQVVVNLALTVEAQGDAAIEVNPVDARALYGEAKGIAQSNPQCLARTTPDEDGEGDRLARLLGRLAEKTQRDAGQEVTRSESDSGRTREPDEDFSELEQQLDDNAEARSEGRELEEEVVLDPSVFDGPQW
jgi:hypothetical protein